MIKYITTIDGKQYEVELLEDGKVCVDGKTYEVDFQEVTGQRIFTMLVDGHSYEAHLSESDDQWNVLMRGTLYTAEVIDEREQRLREAGGQSQNDNGEFTLKAPMPGLVVKIPISVGDEIAKGEVLIILESMKMQNELKAPRDCKVMQIYIEEGDSVEQKQEILQLE